MTDNARRSPIDTTPYTLEMPEAPVSWPEIFGRDRPVELEIGSGKGLFLANAARGNPSHDFLGVEMAKKYAYKAAERLAKANLSNVKILPGDARRFLHLFVPAASVSAVHIYFPDPWWKTRHRKRRVFCEDFVVDVAKSLTPGGDFLIATDVEEYFGVMMELMDRHEEFTEQARPEPKTPEHEHDYLTNFERKYRIEGRPIHRAHYKKTTA
ncbi:MAG: tRNA ((7)-)-methyltransferase [Planctomycetota bacterium]|nr:tRNA ((7)-)-methyltransferase [Planctomycetota bacterium]